MNNETYLDATGFVGNPFASTNSEHEESLADYFVPPPYFESVLGSPKSPKSTIVFAPRGSGKTAQRRMIEIASSTYADGFACITYDDFSRLNPKTASLEDHQVALCRLLTTAALSHLHDDPSRADQLSSHSKQVLKYSATSLLNGLSQKDLNSAIGAVKSLGDKAGDAWRKYGGVLAVGMSAIFHKLGFDRIEMPAELISQSKEGAELSSYLYPHLVESLLEMGFSAVYILVDKVDETSRTGNSPELSFELVRSLLMDLPTIEQPGVAYKFFLWDKTEDMFVQSGGRGDRIGVAQLRWTVPELTEMLSRRLEAFSQKRISSFNQLVDSSVEFDVHQLLAHLSPDSPRDMIRMCDRIVAEHTRQPGYGDKISERAILRGISEFSKTRTNELFGKYMKDLLRIPEPSFTINRLASDVFKISTTAVRNKIVSWVEAGAVEKIGEVSLGAKPVHTYALKDPRMALVIATPVGLKAMLREQIFICSGCEVMRITSDPTLSCRECGIEGDVSDVKSLLAVCSL